MRLFSATLTATFLLATPSFAADKQLSEGQLRQLIQGCFSSFTSPVDAPYNADRKQLARLGFAIRKDTPARLEAYRPNNLQAPSRYEGVTYQMGRHRRKQTELKFKSCKLEGFGFSSVKAQRADEILKQEAGKAGFKPVRNKKRDIVWVRGATVVKLSVLFRLNPGQPIAQAYPTHIIVDGVHEKSLP